MEEEVLIHVVVSIVVVLLTSNVIVPNLLNATLQLLGGSLLPRMVYPPRKLKVGSIIGVPSVSAV